MNARHPIASHDHLEWSHVRMSPVLERFLEEPIGIPSPEVSLAWIKKERQRLGYASPDFRYESRVAYVRLDRPQSTEAFNKNKMYETIAWKLLYEYFRKIDPEVSVFITSTHDDIFSGCDFVICKDDLCVRIDLTTGVDRLKSFEQNLSLMTISKKVEKFYDNPGIPYEFFASVKPHLIPKPLPLIILRIDRSILSMFIQDFFEILSREKTQIDILSYFWVWIDENTDIIEERIAYILGLAKTQDEYDDIEKLTIQIGILFAGMNGVSVAEMTKLR